MSELVEKMCTSRIGDVRTSEHGYDELAEDGLTTSEVLANIPDTVVIGGYLSYPKGPCVLFLPKGRTRAPIHVVWGIPNGDNHPIVLVTANRWLVSDRIIEFVRNPN